MYNNPELTKRLIAVWKKSLGDENVEILDPVMGGEDFSEYSLPDHSIPAVNFHFGAVDPAKIAELQTERGSTCRPCIRANSHPFPSQQFAPASDDSAVLELMKK